MNYRALTASLLHVVLLSQLSAAVDSIPTLQTKLTALDALAGSGFGGAVAVSRDRVVVGAPFLSTSHVRSGAAYVFESRGDSWVQVAKLSPSIARDEQGFGRAVAIDGNTILVGEAGAVTVFELNSAGGWRETTRIERVPPGLSIVPFGTAVAVSGDTLAATGPDEEIGIQAAVYVYQRANSDEGFQLVRQIRSAGVGLWFGRALALDGNSLVVTSPGIQFSFRPSAPALTQLAEVFERDRGGPGQWGSVAILHPVDGPLTGGPASSVAKDGDLIVVGADRLSDLSLAPAAYLYHRNLGGPDRWGRIKKLEMPDVKREDRFGLSVAIGGALLAVGSLEDGAGADSGTVHIFERDYGGLNAWGRATKIAAFDASAGARFGDVLAMDGTRLVVGAPGTNAVYVIELGDLHRCDMRLSFSNGELTVAFGFKTPFPVVWNLWLSNYNTMDRLWSKPIGRIDEPGVELVLTSSGIPSVGRLGIVTTFVHQGGIVCKDFQTVDTGAPVSGVTNESLKKLLLQGARLSSRQ